MNQKEMIKEIRSRIKFESIDHSDKYMLDLQFRVVRQRCVICGELYPIYDRHAMGFFEPDILITLCPECAEPYHVKTWTERQIEAGARALEEVSK